MKLRIATKLVAATFLVGAFASDAWSYPARYCYQNGNPILKYDKSRRFAKNNWEFTGTENNRIHQAVLGWQKNRIGETSINFSSNSNSTSAINNAYINCDNDLNATGNWSQYDICMYFGMSPQSQHVIYRRGPIVYLQDGVDEPNNPFIPGGVKETTYGWVNVRIADPATGNYSPVLQNACLNNVPNNLNGAGGGYPKYVAGRNIIVHRAQYPGYPYGSNKPSVGSFNQIYNFSSGQPNTDLNLLVSHEMGHIFGLVHPSTGANDVWSLMHASYGDALANYQGSYSGKWGNRKAQPLPIDSKNLRNLYPANSPSLTSVGTQQWQWTNSPNSSWKVRAQNAYKSSSGQGSQAVTSAPYSLVDAYQVPVTIHNKGTTEKWTEGRVRFKKVNQNVFAPSSSFGAQMPPRTSVSFSRWIEKPSPNNSANAGVYEIVTYITKPAVSSMSQSQPLRFNYRSQSGRQFTFY